MVLSYPPPLEPIDLALAFLRGDRDAIVLHYARLACSVANRFGQHADDLVSECLLKLTESFWTILRHPTPDKYVMTRIKGVCYNNNKLSAREIGSYPTTSDEEESEEHRLMVLREEIGVITAEHRDIFDLREQGYDDPEISKMLGITKDTIGRIRRNAYTRFYHAAK